jgi:hypothetical protein
MMLSVLCSHWWQESDLPESVLSATRSRGRVTYKAAKRELTSMTPKRKRWLWIAFWTALAIATALMWPWDWAGW